MRAVLFQVQTYVFHWDSILELAWQCWKDTCGGDVVDIKGCITFGTNVHTFGFVWYVGLSPPNGSVKLVCYYSCLKERICHPHIRRPPTYQKSPSFLILLISRIIQSMAILISIGQSKHICFTSFFITILLITLFMSLDRPRFNTTP